MKRVIRKPGDIEVMRDIHAEMALRRLSVRQLAVKIEYSENYTHKVLQGWKTSQKARQAIENFFNQPFWSGDL